MMNLEKTSKELPVVKRFLLKKLIKHKLKRTSTSYSIAMITTRKLSIMHKLDRDPLEPSPAPGSLEENCEFPDNYLESDTLPNFPSNYSSNYQLRPTDIYKGNSKVIHSRIQAKSNIQTDITRKMLVRKLSFSSGLLHFNKDTTRNYKQIPLLQDTKDFILMEQYKDIGERINSCGSYATSRFTSSSMEKQYDDSRQDRFFAVFNAEEKNTKNYYKTLYRNIGRKPYESLLARTNTFREKVELAQAMEMATPTAIIYGDQSWYLSLRSSPKFKDTKNYTLPVGCSRDGLWVHVTENPNNQVVVIRKPGPQTRRFKCYLDHPFVQDKKTKEFKRVKELLPVISNKDISKLIVSFK
jgi:hypothetical protein